MHRHALGACSPWCSGKPHGRQRSASRPRSGAGWCRRGDRAGRASAARSRTMTSITPVSVVTGVKLIEPTDKGGAQTGSSAGAWPGSTGAAAGDRGGPQGCPRPSKRRCRRSGRGPPGIRSCSFEQRACGPARCDSLISFCSSRYSEGRRPRRSLAADRPCRPTGRSSARHVPDLLHELGVVGAEADPHHAASLSSF